MLSILERSEQLRKLVARYKGAVNTEVATSEPEHIATGDLFLDPFLHEVNQTFANAQRLIGPGSVRPAPIMLRVQMEWCEMDAGLPSPFIRRLNLFCRDSGGFAVTGTCAGEYSASRRSVPEK